MSLIITTAGQAKVAAAVAGTPLLLTHLATGDGNGSAVTPNGSETTLVNESFRTTLSSYNITASNNKVEVEAVVPASAGGFTIRELGIFAEDGTLVAYTATPETEKPSSGGNAGSEIRFNAVLVLSSLTNVSVTVDTALGVTVATLNQKIAETKATLTGCVLPFAKTAAPSADWLLCDGANITAVQYPELVLYLTGDDQATATTLPDLRGEFIRGLDLGRAVDVDRNTDGNANTPGSTQSEDFKSHSHTKKYAYVAGGALNHGFMYNDPDVYHGGGDSRSNGGDKTMTTNSNGGSETRPRNIAFPYFIHI